MRSSSASAGRVAGRTSSIAAVSVTREWPVLSLTARAGVCSALERIGSLRRRSAQIMALFMIHSPFYSGKWLRSPDRPGYCAVGDGGAGGAVSGLRRGSFGKAPQRDAELLGLVGEVG